MEKIKPNKQNLIPAQVSKQILTIGPQHKNHRGGIGAVIDIYSRYFEVFQFIKSYKPGSKLLISLLFLRSIVLLIIKLIFNREIQIVHLHGSKGGSIFRKYIYFLIVKYIFGKKVIYHIHGSEYHLFYSKNNAIIKNLIRSFINHVDCIICLSDWWKFFFESNFDPKRIEIIPNIIDYPSVLKPINKTTHLTLLFLGYIGNRKGIFDLLKVIAEKRERYVGKIRLIIGGNGDVEKLESLIQSHNLFEIVEFVGWISNTEKDTWLQTADVYILPSYNEGLPISILEAMSYGQPIISTNVGGIPEIVQTNKNGILIEPGNMNAIESAIDFFIEHPEKIKAYGNESKQLVKKHLPAEVMKELITVYGSQLENE